MTANAPAFMKMGSVDGDAADRKKAIPLAVPADPDVLRADPAGGEDLDQFYPQDCGRSALRQRKYPGNDKDVVLDAVGNDLGVQRVG